ncbi:hypothetical protein [Hymenobacter siberiensis]|uniref:hypothetical protein n=1 Tax=Hymenobacter siberiensis TaxID=2848396 RepID=UPI001C1E724D|nr:hypothetical protein [Hymenobacter siberiensis]
MATSAVVRSNAHRELTKIMDVNVPIDGMMSILAGEKIIDICKLDDTLKKKHASSYKDNDSMKDFITRQFGPRATELTMLLMA